MSKAVQLDEPFPVLEGLNQGCFSRTGFMRTADLILQTGNKSQVQNNFSCSKSELCATLCSQRATTTKVRCLGASHITSHICTIRSL